MFTSVIIPAAGFGQRMGSAIAKQFLSIGGIPILAQTLQRFQQCAEVDEIVIATQKSSIDQIVALCERNGITKAKRPVLGGERRQDSVSLALSHLDHLSEIVVVHDAVRPFIHIGLITQSIDAAKNFGAAVVAVRVKDTVKKATTDGKVDMTLERSSLWNVQTPQAFQRKLIVQAYEYAAQKGIDATDDSYLAEQIGLSPVIVEGSYENIKVTTPEDLLLAELIHKRFVP